MGLVISIVLFDYIEMKSILKYPGYCPKYRLQPMVFIKKRQTYILFQTYTYTVYCLQHKYSIS